MSSNENKVIHPKRVPTKLPIALTIQAALIVKVSEIDSWGLVVAASIVTVVWIYRLSRVSIENYYDPFDPK